MPADILDKIGPGNGMMPTKCQTITWINYDSLTNVSLEQYTNIFIEENQFENVVCKMAAISSSPQCVKMPVAFTWGWFHKLIKTSVSKCV